MPPVPAPVPDPPDDDAYYIDGRNWTSDDLTFGEQRRVRDLIRYLAPENDPVQASEADVNAAFIAVIKQKADPAYTVDQALELTPADIRPPKADPTPPAKTKAS